MIDLPLWCGDRWLLQTTPVVGSGHSIYIYILVMVNHLYSHQFWRVQQSSGPTRGPINNIVNMLKKEHTMNQHQPMRYYVCKPTQHIHIVCIGFSLFQ